MRGRAYTDEEILAAVRRWAREHGGVPPRASDWVRAGEYWPVASMVCRRFGTWANAVEWAGFPRPVQGVAARKRGLAVVPDDPDVTVGKPALEVTLDILLALSKCGGREREVFVDSVFLGRSDVEMAADHGVSRQRVGALRKKAEQVVLRELGHGGRLAA